MSLLPAGEPAAGAWSASGIVVAHGGTDADEFLRAEVEANALPRLTAYAENVSASNLHHYRLGRGLHDGVDRAGVQRPAHNATRRGRAAGIRDQLPLPVAVRVLDQIRRVRPQREDGMQQPAKEGVFSSGLYLIIESRPV